MPASVVAEVVDALGSKAVHDALTPKQRLAVRYCWPLWARPLGRLPTGEYTGQVEPPVDFVTWLVLAGRGFGKSRLATEWVRGKAEKFPGCRIAMMGRTAGEARKVLGFGDSGLMNVCPPWFRPSWSVVDQCFHFPNGSMAFLYSAEEPDSTRGLQHHFAVADELAAWRRAAEAWSNLMMGLRLGAHPRVVVTTTPRPLELLRELRKRPSTVVTRGATFDNAANLPRSFLEEMQGQFGGSSLGQQELLGELLDQAPGALWQRSWLDKHRVPKAPALIRIAVGVDPSASDGEEHDEAGIVVVGLGDNGHCYVLEDASILASPDQWARRVARAYQDNDADFVVEETVRGGAMASSVIKLVDPKIPIRTRGGNRGKRSRAEPIAALYEMGKVHHVGTFRELEDELCSFTASSPKSPNRLDSLVYAVASLALEKPPSMAGLNSGPGIAPRRM
jgi:phage terminase large subunit-like protein